MSDEGKVKHYNPTKDSLGETLKCAEYQMHIWRGTQFMSSKNLKKVAKFVEDLQ